MRQLSVLRILSATAVITMTLRLGCTTGYFASFNLFAYCANNPVMSSDPSGHYKIYGLKVNLKAKGFTVKFSTFFLSKSNCRKFAEKLIKDQKENGKFRGMNKTRIAKELFAHAVLFCAGVGSVGGGTVFNFISNVPKAKARIIKKVLSKALFKFGSYLIEHCKDIYVNNDEKWYRMMVYNYIYYNLPLY